MITKTAAMLGLGETAAEVQALLRDARAAGCAVIYLGQYLQPSKQHAPVERFVAPAEFDAYRDQALALGFDVVVAAPLVRSSFHTAEQSAYVQRRLRQE